MSLQKNLKVNSYYSYFRTPDKFKILELYDINYHIRLTLKHKIYFGVR